MSESKQGIHKMVVKSLIEDVEVPEVTMHMALMARMRMFEDRVALVSATTDEKITYNQLVDRIISVASGLVRQGVVKGDIIALYAKNSPEYIIAVLGVLAAGGSVAGVNPAYNEEELLHQMQVMQAKWIISTKEGVVKINSLAKQLQLRGIITFDSCAGCIKFADLLSDDGSLYPNYQYNPKEDVAFILFSSGTSGLPKGVMLTHYNLMANTVQIGHPRFFPDEVAEENSPPHVSILYLPMFHAFGLYGVMVLTLFSGSTLVILPRFEPDLFLSSIQKYKVTYLPMVPPTAAFLAKSPLVAKYDLSSVKRASSGGAPLPRDVEAKLSERFPLQAYRQSYGMTEVTCAAMRPPPELKSDTKPGTVGILLPNMEVKIVDPDTGEEVGKHQPGEIWMRGPNVMKGYINNKQATDDVIDKDGFLHSGDVGYYDDDGCFYIVDRIKELIKYKGYQVAPAELESIIASHPAVADVAVIGVPAGDDGEVPRAYVALHRGQTITAEQLIKHVDSHVTSYKRLRGGVHFLAEIPRTQTGKILRRQLRQLAQASTGSKL